MSKIIGVSMEKIVIVMTTDKNYIVPTKVAIYSMWKSTQNVWFEIHILCDYNLDVDSKEELKELAHCLQRVSIVFDEVRDESLKNANTLGHIPVASYYRLYISRLLDCERCLFIDGDMIIQEDLRAIYNIDLNGYYIAGVRDCAVQSKNPAFADHQKDLNIPNMHQYVNAGFMLFNLDAIRENGMDNVFIDAIDDGYKYMDQDILNKFCYGKIKHLPLRYNLFGEFYGRLDKLSETDYTEEEIREAENWAVLHYPGGYKPWTCSRLRANQIWWQVAKNVLSDEEYTQWKEKANESERHSDWSYIVEQIGTCKDVIIFGYCQMGCEVEVQLERTVPGVMVAFADNDLNKQGMKHKKVCVLSAEEAVKKYAKGFWIIMSQVAHTDIKKQLMELGVAEKRIARYIYKTVAYYEGLDEENYRYEMKILEKTE